MKFYGGAQGGNRNVILVAIWITMLAVQIRNMAIAPQIMSGFLEFSG